MEINPVLLCLGATVAVWLVIYLVPAAKIIGKVGYSKWWCILAIVPVVNLIAYWIFAFARWPALRDEGGVYSEAIKRDPANPDNYLVRGHFYQTVAIIRNKPACLDRAIADFDVVIGLRDGPRARLARGEVYTSRGDSVRAAEDFKAALVQLDAALAERPDSGELLVLRGQVYLAKADYDHAIADFNAAMSRPTAKPAGHSDGVVNADAYAGRARAYESKGDFPQAVADCTEAIKIVAASAESRERLRLPVYHMQRAVSYVLLAKVARARANRGVAREYKRRANDDMRSANALERA